MKRVLRYLIYLYPARWRRRYGKELETLLEDSGSRSRDIWDLFRGAMQMQISRWSFVGIVVLSGIMGLVLTSAIAFSMPYRYQSTAILRTTPRDPDALKQVLDAALTPQALSDIIKREHLYADKPVEVGVDLMRLAIRIEPAGPNQDRVSFAYQDPSLALRTTQDLVTKIISANVEYHQGNMRLEVRDPPTQPEKQGERKRYALAHLGIPVGLLFGFVLALILRRRAPAAS